MILNPNTLIEEKVISATSEQWPLVISGPNSQIQCNSIDLRLASAHVLHQTQTAFFCSDKSKNSLPTYSPAPVMQKQIGNENFDVIFFAKDQHYSLTFMEDVNVPADACAFIRHRSTVARFMGWIFSSLFDSGFQSSGGCGALFQPKADVFIVVGTRVAQIYFCKAETAHLYNGQYQNKTAEQWVTN